MGDDSGMDPDGASDTGTPRWVKVFGIVGLVVVILVVVLLVTGGGGGHGPGRHLGGDRGTTVPSADVEHRPPSGGHTP